MLGVVITVALVIVATLLLLLIWLGARPTPSPAMKAPARTQLTRKWARAMFYNGLISIEELNHFYETLPPDAEPDQNG